MIISAKIQDESEVKLEGYESDRMQLESRVIAGERLLAQLRGNLYSILALVMVEDPKLNVSNISYFRIFMNNSIRKCNNRILDLIAQLIAYFNRDLK